VIPYGMQAPVVVQMLLAQTNILLCTSFNLFHGGKVIVTTSSEGLLVCEVFSNC